MILSEIWVYPVKSLGGIRLKESLAEERGLQHDRRWLVVDEKGTFLTQRTNAQMALLDVAFSDDGLLISHRYDPVNQILVPFEREDDVDIEVKIWNDIVSARTVSNLADEWLSERLGKIVRIVEMTTGTQRRMNPLYAGTDHTVSFADDFPFLLISQASLDDLNSKLSQSVEMKRFRPNFVITGTAPFEEDLWNTITIGDTRFQVTKPCERCVMVNIDPKTGIKSPETLKMLSSYRKEGKEIFFGQNVVGLESGIVREGDSITLL
ncbi:MOSC domain-containing protein [Dyadobacter fanqingshengii]|uniref:MOSC domain-containing protein n=1 Tax=Dyadobacter fanqingshengii TaxID=2906443 RepID=A0A9X1PAY2_9BACT|nr:MOSC N-terminal beta barrel domain-containing protein [Dyadobacter fanqingshengii]MCF0041192.1 MOSC domain-containing protein [Dyadobacter fanqingshengii]USJ37082.1 MOSC domain-containing protein [Dyadobacter fanqingshengii]